MIARHTGINLTLLFTVLAGAWGIHTLLLAYAVPPRLEQAQSVHIPPPPHRRKEHAQAAASFRQRRQKRQDNEPWRKHAEAVADRLRQEDSVAKTKTISQEDPYYDKEKIMDMLRAMNVDPASIDNATWTKVPTWSRIQEIWGTEPKIWGLERDSCRAFLDEIEPKKRRIAVAGLFSTGTNLLAQLLQHNCAIPERVAWLKNRQRGHGMEWQVPWGKHNPFRYRGKHFVQTFVNDKRKPQLEDFFPAVTLRDPYSWMSSMCRNSYTAQWRHNRKHCPNFRDVRTGATNKVSVKFGAEPNFRVPFPSLADMWNIWNGEYYNETKIPLLLVRFEDIVFYPRELTYKICQCAGGNITEPLKVYSDKDHSAGDFHYVVGTAVNGPGHGKPVAKRNGLVEAWIKYAKPYQDRIAFLSPEDLQFAQQVLDHRIMDFFGYSPPLGA